MSELLFANGDAITQRAGQIVRLNGGGVTLALADLLANSTKIIGTRLYDVNVSSSGVIVPLITGSRVSCDAEPVINQELWLSNINPGNASVKEPAFSVLLGSCFAKEQINGVWYAYLVPIIVSQSGPSLAKGQFPIGTGTSVVASSVGTDNQLDIYNSASETGKSPQSLTGLMTTVLEQPAITTVVDATVITMPMVNFSRYFEAEIYMPAAAIPALGVYLAADGLNLTTDSWVTTQTGSTTSATTRMSGYAKIGQSVNSGSSTGMLQARKSPDGTWFYTSDWRTHASGSYFALRCTGSIPPFSTSIALVTTISDVFRAGTKITYRGY